MVDEWDIEDVKQMMQYIHLTEAVARGNHVKVKACIDNGAPLDFQDDDGRTALHLASADPGNFHIAQMLVDAGASLNIQNKWKLTVLHLATMHHHLDIVKLLINKEAQLELQTKWGNTTLDLANTPEIKNILKQALVQRIVVDFKPVLELCYQDQPGAAKYFVDLVGQFWGGVRALSTIG